MKCHSNELPSWTVTQCLRLNRLRSFIPIHRTLSEIRLVRHVTTERRVVAEYDVLHHRLPGSDSLEKIPEMRLQIVVIIAFETLRFESRFMAELRVMFRMPLLEVWF